MAQNGQDAAGNVMNKKQTATNFSVRLDKLETMINEIKKETDENLKTVFQKLQCNLAKSDQMWQLLLQLQELSHEDGKRILNLEQNRTNDIGVIKCLKNDLSKVKSQLLLAVEPRPKELPDTAENTMACQLANTVDSVVGLREAVTWKFRWLRWIWVLTLSVGIVATVWFVYASTAEYLDEPTATKVKLVTQPNYDYPSIFLCSAAWIDTPKALSLGLSLDGLKYSLGYINSKGDKPSPTNITQAKQEFIDFFDKHNFTSFSDYLMAISVDVPVIQTIEAYTENLSTSAMCTFCKNDSAPLLPKNVFDGQMCYSFQLRPEANHGSLFERYIGIKLVDRTLGLIQNSAWTLYVSAIAALRTSALSQKIIINSLTIASVRITSEQFFALNTTESVCVPQENVLDNCYSERVCIAECLVPIHSQYSNCTPYDVTVNTTEYHPKELCNAFDNTDAQSFWARRDISRTSVEKVTSSKEAENCYQKCPQRCHRTTYEAARQRDVSFVDVNPATALLANQARLLNISIVGLFVEHAAVSQGGIMTWKEFSTISFTTMVSNIGGALGLFVGGTVMTFVQLILFFVRFALERRNKTLIGDVAFIRTSHL